jgi:hypothetical protein
VLSHRPGQWTQRASVDWAAPLATRPTMAGKVESALSQSDAIAGCEVIYQSVLKLLMFMVARSLDLLAPHPHVLLVCLALAGI